MIETDISHAVESSSLSENTSLTEIKTEVVLPIAQSKEICETNPWMTLDPRSQNLERIRWWFLTGIVGTILGIGWLLTGVLRGSFDATQWVSLTLIAMVVLAGLLASRYFPKKEFQATSWQLKSAGLEIRHGLWWRHRIFIPFDRIQHTDVQQGPLMRMYGLASLVINTGGTHAPSIPLSGLSMSMAEQIRDKLANRFPNSPKHPQSTVDSQVG